MPLEFAAQALCGSVTVLPKIQETVKEPEKIFLKVSRKITVNFFLGGGEWKGSLTSF